MRLPVAMLCLAVALAAGEAQARVADPVRGRHLAIEACAACHKVTAGQKQPAPVADPDGGDSIAAPSFFAIAAKFGRDKPSLRAFILAPAHPMREQTFVPRDLGDIVAYIASLRAAKRAF